MRKTLTKEIIKKYLEQYYGWKLIVFLPFYLLLFLPLYYYFFLSSRAQSETIFFIIWLCVFLIVLIASTIVLFILAKINAVRYASSFCLEESCLVFLNKKDNTLYYSFLEHNKAITLSLDKISKVIVFKDFAIALEESTLYCIPRDIADCFKTKIIFANKKYINVVSLFLMSLAILGGLLGFGVVFTIADKNTFWYLSTPKYIWICYFFLIFPICSLCVGIWGVLKKKNTRKNIVSGSIMAIILISCGSLHFVKAIAPTESTDYLTKLEEQYEFGVPTNATTFSVNYKKGFLSYSKILDENDLMLFENDIKNSSKWCDYRLNDFSKSLIPYEIYNRDSGEFGYYMCYIAELDIYNPVELPKGEYTLVYLRYNKLKKYLLSLTDYNIRV